MKRNADIGRFTNPSSLDLIDSLNQPIKINKGRAVLSDIFAERVDFTKRHFSDNDAL